MLPNRKENFEKIYIKHFTRLAKPFTNIAAVLLNRVGNKQKAVIL